MSSTRATRSGLAAGWLAAGLLPLAGCDDHPPATPAAAPVATPPPAAALAAPPPQPAYTLILTWLAFDQPPQTTQTVFHDAAACNQARDAAIAEGRRLASEAAQALEAANAKAAHSDRRYIGGTLLSSGAPAPASAPAVPPPKVAAICAGP